MIVAPPPADLDFEQPPGRRAGRAGVVRLLRARRLGVLEDPGHEAADHRLRARRLARRARRVDRREVPHVERLRRRRRAPLHQGPAARQHHVVLAHRHRPLRRAALLRGRADRRVRARPDGSRCRSGSPRSPRRSSARPGTGPSSATTSAHWTEMPRGGHFAAFEEGDLLVDDVRDFFRPCGSAPEPPGPSTFGSARRTLVCELALPSRRVAGHG